MKDKDIGSLEHTSWRCQYHIVFAPKYRRQAIYREIKVDIGKILRQLCQQKRSGDHRGRAVSGSHTHACKYPTEIQCIAGNGVSEGKEQSDDIRQACESEIQVREQTFLGERVFRGHGRTKQEANPGIHQESIERG